MALLRHVPHPLLTASPHHAAAGQSYQVPHTALAAFMGMITLRVLGAHDGLVLFGYGPDLCGHGRFFEA